MSAVRVLGLISLGVGIILLCLLLGPYPINPLQCTDIERDILFSVRLPRILVAALMGMALGASGAVLQGILKNPLADPYILGISSGAALSATLGLVSGVYVLGKVSIPFTAFVGSSFTSAIVGVLGWKKGKLLPERLLLAGVGLGFLLYAMLMFLISISSHEGMRRAVLWIFGDLSLADWSVLPYGSFFVLAGFWISVARTKALNALMLGDDIAYSLGFAVHRERLLFFTAVSLMTSASVSLGGTIGFIGLLIPHMVRFLTGPDNKLVVPLSALYGGVFLCIADLIGRSLLPPMEIPSGIITALIGSPYFLYLLRKRDILTV